MQRRHIHNPSRTTNKAYIVETTLLPPTSPARETSKKCPLNSRRRTRRTVGVIGEGNTRIACHSTTSLWWYRFSVTLLYTHSDRVYTLRRRAQATAPLQATDTDTDLPQTTHTPSDTIQGVRLYHPPSSDPMRVLNVCVSGNELLSCWCWCTVTVSYGNLLLRSEATFLGIHVIRFPEACFIWHWSNRDGQTL